LSDVPDSFNLRDQIKAKIYHYTISNNKKNPFISRYAWTIQHLPEIGKLNQFFSVIKGKHDFSMFAKESYRYSSTICEIFRIESNLSNNANEIIIEIEGDRFLYNMVRRIIGFAVYLALKQKISQPTFEKLTFVYINQTNMRAPACGLSLYRVILFGDS
jgi:tRNA pseudouridine38-40 synthase